MKILITAFDFRPRLGGVATCGFELARALSAVDGVAVMVIAPEQQGCEEFDALSKLGTKRIRLPKSAYKSVIPLALYLRKQLNEFKPDAILNMLWFPCGAATYLAGLFRSGQPRVPYYVMAHGMELMEACGTWKKRLRRRHSFAKRQVLQGASGVLAVSSFTRDLAITEGRLEPMKVTVCPNGVDGAVFFRRPRRADLLTRFGLESKTVFLTVSRLVQNKGIDLALKALAILLKKNRAVHYLVVGVGPDEIRLKSLTAELSLLEHVTFVGAVSSAELTDYYGLADCFVLLSREDKQAPQVEGFGIVFLEAAACGLPSIAGRSGGIPDVIINGETGWLVNSDPNDSRAIIEVAGCMERCLDSDYTKSIGKDAQKRAIEEFPWSKAAEKVLKQIKKSNVDTDKNISKAGVICFYSIATHLGGAERSLLDLMLNLKNSSQGRYRAWLVVPKNSGPLLELLRARADAETPASEIKITCLEMPAVFMEISRSRPLAAIVKAIWSIPAMCLYALKLVRLLRSEAPEIIHTTGIKCHLFAAFTAPLHGRVVLWHLRDIINQRVTKILFQLSAKVANLSIIANSKATARSLNVRTKRGYVNKIKVIYNGLDQRAFKVSPHKKMQQRLGLSPETKLVAILGVLAQWKGQLNFIEMAKRLVEKGSKAHFLIIGDEIYDTSGSDRGFRNELEARINELGLAAQVHCLGFEKNPAEVLNSIDVLVHASVKPEPFGRVILEAMACGVPVVATKIGGVLELIEDEKSGLLYAPEDVGQLTHQTNRLLNSSELRQKLSIQARKRFESDFTIEQHMFNVINTYDDLSSSKPGKKPVAIVINDLNTWGGQERSVLEIARYLSHEREVDLYAYTLNDPGFPDSWGRVRYHKIWPRISRPAFPRFVVFQLFTLLPLLIVSLRKKAIIHATGTCSLISDVVQVQFVHTAWHNSPKEADDKRIGVFGIWGIYHSCLMSYNMWLERKLYRKPRKFIALADVVKNELLKNFGNQLEPTDIVVARHGVDSNKFHPYSEKETAREERARIRKGLGIRDNDLIALFVGAYSRKGIVAAIHSLAKVVPQNVSTGRNLYLVAVGSGDVQKYKKLSESLGVAEWVKFVSHTTNIIPYYWCGDMFLLPTLYEPFGLVILEAMACGLAPIVSKLAGGSELLEHGDSGLLIHNPKDSEEIAGYLKLLVTDDVLRISMGQQAAKVAKLRTWKQVAEEYTKDL